MMHSPHNGIGKTSKAEVVSEYIRDGILSGIWKPGDRVDDLEIANNLGISRPSVREALAKLAESDLLYKIQWKGYYVKTLSRREIESIIELRKALEKIAIQRLSRHGEPGQFRKLKEVINKSEEAFYENDQLKYLKTDFLFHELLYDFSGNPYIKKMISNLMFGINVMRNSSVNLMNEFQDTATASISDHRNILAAMEAGDETKAFALIEAHLDEHLYYVNRNLSLPTNQYAPPEPAYDMKMTLGESPFWHAEAGLLIWIDVRQGKLYASSPEGGEPEILYSGEHIGGFTLQESGDILLFFNNGAIRSFSFDTKSIRDIHVTLPENTDSTYFNDVIADPRGRVFVGSIASRLAHGAVYRIDTDGIATKVITDLQISNGMGFSPDNRFFYHTDSSRHCINRYVYHEATGELGKKTLFYQLEASVEPDGMTVDSEGNVLSAVWNGGAVLVISPEGKLARTIEVPAHNPTSLCFAGEDLSTLYVTSAGGENRSRNGELAGAVFRIETQTKGRLEYKSRILL